MQKTEKFLKPRKHFCCLRASQKLTPAEDSVRSHATKMTSYCKRCREELQDNQTDGEPFLKGCTKNLARLAEQNKAKRECDFRQASHVNNQRENSTPSNYRTAAQPQNSKKHSKPQHVHLESFYPQKWSFGNFQTPVRWKGEKNLPGFDMKLDHIINLCFIL